MAYQYRCIATGTKPLQVLRSKGAVLSIEVKLLCKQEQVCVKKLSFTEPSHEMSKRLLVSESKGIYDRCK